VVADPGVMIDGVLGLDFFRRGRIALLSRRWWQFWR
jgi:hypothetical protein